MRAYLLGGRPIFYPFLSGIFSYTCQGCPAPCCHGTKLGIGKSRELVTLRKALPEITLFASPGYAGSAMLALDAPLEACWFLDRKNRCRLEHHVSRSAKPAGCRLFPFQRIRAAGHTICVMPDFHCPIEVEEYPSEEGPTSYDELTLEIHRAFIPPRGHVHLAPPGDIDWARLIKLERRIVRRSENFLGSSSYLRFAENQVEASRPFLSQDFSPPDLARLDKRIRYRLGVSTPSTAAVVQDLVALTGVLRMAHTNLTRAEIPSLLLALAALTDVYQDMRGARRSPRTIVSLMEHRLPFLYVLSHLLDRPMLRGGAHAHKLLADFPALRAPLLEVLQHIADNRTARVQRPLDAILKQQGSVFEPPLDFEAVAMLFGLGRVLLKFGEFGRAF